ncbi:MAG: hypothetical protein RSE17_02860 [Bacilli bacterium]
MEINKLKGSIIGVISENFELVDYNNLLVKDIITKKTDDSLKMVGIHENIKNMEFNELTDKDKSKVILASKLNSKEIILYDFTKGMLNKELLFFKNLFKKLVTYDKKVILVSKDINFFLNLVDNLYVINKDEVVFETNDFFNYELYKYVDMPPIISFIKKCQINNIMVENYTEFNELLKAVYRIKQ